MSKLQSNSHSGLPEFVCERSVFDRSREHHTSHAKRSERERALPCRRRSRRHALLEGFDHHPERRFLGQSDRLVRAGKIIGQADQGTTRLDFFEVLSGKIVADDPGRVIRRIFSGIGCFLLLIYKMTDRLGIKLAFALKITVEAASRQARSGHDIIDRDGTVTVAIKQLYCALDDPLPDVFAIRI